MIISRNKANIIVDAIMYICFMFLIFSGLLIKYILLPGFKRNLKYNADVDLFFMGMDRHQWGEIHFIISLILIAFLVFHFILHWKSIKGKMKRVINKSIISRFIYLSSILLIIGCVFGTFMIKPELKIKEHQHLNRIQEGEIIKSKIKPERSEEVEIWGSMSLKQAAEKYNVPVNELVVLLGITQNESNERIGRLRKKYDFSMKELEELIDKNCSK